MDSSCLANTGFDLVLALSLVAGLGGVTPLIWLAVNRRFKLGSVLLIILMSLGLLVEITPAVMAQSSCPPSSPPMTVPSIPNPRPTPAAPTINSPSSGEVVSINTPIITGIGENGATVTVRDADLNILCTATVSNNAWSCATSPLQDGTHAITATQAKEGSSDSPASNSITLIIDALAPAAPVITVPAGGSIINDNTPSISGTGESGAMLHLSIDGTVVADLTVAASGDWSFTPPSSLSDGQHTLSASQTDAGGNNSPNSPITSFSIDTAAPSVTINQKSTQADPTSVNSVFFTVTFSKPILADSFVVGDIALNSPSAPNSYIAAFTQLNPTSWEFEVKGLVNNTAVSVTISAGSAQDFAGNTNSASTSTDNTVLYLVPPPNVTELVTNDSTPDLSGQCSAGDSLNISLTGPASVTLPAVCDSGNTWNLNVSSTLPEGTYTASVTDTTASITGPSTQIVIDATMPQVTVNQKAGQPDPTSTDSASFTVTFSEVIEPGSFSPSNFSISGTSGTITTFTQLTPTVWEATVTGMSSGDTVSLSLPAGQVADIAGNNNAASTSTDNNVTYEVPAPPPQHFCEEESTWTCVPTTGNVYGEKTFGVPARQMFVSSGLYLAQGETANISESGDWFVNSDMGDPYGTCNIGNLVVRIGLEYDGSDSEQDFTCVNGSISFTAPASGILYVGALTGSDLGDFYGNRYPASGSKNVTISSSGRTVPTIRASEAATYPFNTVTSGFVEIWGDHVIMTLPTSVAQMDAATIENAANRLDDIYEFHAEIQPKLPYHGQRIRFYEDAEAPGYMLAGNPVRAKPSAFSGTDPKERITRAGEAGSYNWAFAHEMGHDFTVPARHWIYMQNTLEVWPNILSCHAFERLGRTSPETHEDWYNRCHDIVAGSGQYAGGTWDAGVGLTFLMYFKHQYDWDFYQAAFADILAVENNSLPWRGSWDNTGWYFVHDIFEDVAAQDITPVFQAWGVPHP